MVDPVEEWVAYHPPKSVSFGHHSVPRDPRKAWPIVKKFLDEVENLQLGHHVELTCHEGGKWTDIAVAEPRIGEAHNLFGPALNPGDPHPRWKISESQLPSAIEFALDDDKYPKQKMGPVSFYFSFQFLWPQFEQRSYWTGKGETRRRQSRLGVTVGGRKLFLQPSFVWPAPWYSQFLRDFVTGVERTLPFRFRDQYFQRWLPPKNAGRGRVLNMPASWRTSISPTDSLVL